MESSVGTARPGLEAAAKARLLEAQAFENLSLSRVRGSQPAQARLRLKPRPCVFIKSLR